MEFGPTSKRVSGAACACSLIYYIPGSIQLLMLASAAAAFLPYCAFDDRTSCNSCFHGGPRPAFAPDALTLDRGENYFEYGTLSSCVMGLGPHPAPMLRELPGGEDGLFFRTDTCHNYFMNSTLAFDLRFRVLWESGSCGRILPLEGLGRGGEIWHQPDSSAGKLRACFHVLLFPT